MTVPDFKRDGLWVRSFRQNGAKKNTLSGSVFNGIENRCRANGSTQQESPCYVGCKNLFTDFQDFTNWHILQVGYGKGFELDKDLLVVDNKIYSKDTCVLIPKELNNLIKTIPKTSSGLVGAYWNETGWRAVINDEKGYRHIGQYSAKEEAHEAYVREKTLLLGRYADKWKGEIDQRIYDVLKNPKQIWKGLFI